MTKFDDKYIDLCKRILSEGERIVNYKKTDSRSAGVKSAIPDHSAQASSASATLRLPHEILSFDLEEEFPILVSKQVGFKTAVLELFWIYQVASNEVSWLHERNVKIWDEWKIPEDGLYQGRDFNQLYKAKGLTENPAETIGTAYGWIVRRYNLVNNLIETLRSNPGNRRMVLSLWQNEWLETAALPSCVWNSEWNVTNGRLNLLVNSRSSDVPLGLPFNIVQYAAFCCMIASVVGVRPGKFTFVTNDAHIYENQIDGIKEQIKKYDEAKASGTLPSAPKLVINPDIKEFKDFDNSRALKDIHLENYQNLGRIIMPVTE